MKIFFTLVAAALTAATFTTNAAVFLTEDFEFEPGTAMYGTNGWLHYSNGTNFEIKTVDDALTLEGYRSTPVGSAVLITGENGEDIAKQFTATDITTGSIFFSALLKITEGNSVVIDALRVADAWEDAFVVEPTTAVADLNVEKVNSVRKYVENGQIVIENSGVKYNIAGQVIK